MTFAMRNGEPRPGWATRTGAIALFGAVGALGLIALLGFALGVFDGSRPVVRTAVIAPIGYRPSPKPPIAPARPLPPGVVANPVAEPEVADASVADAVAAAKTFAEELRMSTSQRVKRWEAFITEASKKYSVPEKWIRAVIIAESAGRTMSDSRRKIISSAGAMGLMQLMPSTYADMRRQEGLGRDPYDPHDNIMAGTAYLHYLHGRYGYPAMFAAYNDGPGHLDERLANERLLPVETITYVERVTGIVLGRGAGKGGLVRFTRPDGSAIMVQGSSVRAVRAALPGEYAESVKSVIVVGEMQQGVREDLATAKSLILSRGGSTRATTRLVTRVVLSCERSETDAAGGRITCRRGVN